MSSQSPRTWPTRNHPTNPASHAKSLLAHLRQHPQAEELKRRGPIPATLPTHRLCSLLRRSCNLLRRWCQQAPFLTKKSRLICKVRPHQHALVRGVKTACCALCMPCCLPMPNFCQSLKALRVCILGVCTKRRAPLDHTAPEP